MLPTKTAVAALRALARATQSRRLLGLYRFLYFVLLVSLDDTVRKRCEGSRVCLCVFGGSCV